MGYVDKYVMWLAKAKGHHEEKSVIDGEDTKKKPLWVILTFKMGFVRKSSH